MSTPHPSPFPLLLSPEEPSWRLLPTLHPDCSLLTYCIACLSPPHSFFWGGSPLLSPFTPPTQKYHPIFGELQDDFSPQHHRSAPRQTSTACKRGRPALAPTPPLRRQKKSICAEGRRLGGDSRPGWSCRTYFCPLPFPTHPWKPSLHGLRQAGRSPACPRSEAASPEPAPGRLSNPSWEAQAARLKPQPAARDSLSFLLTEAKGSIPQVFQPSSRLVAESDTTQRGSGKRETKQKIAPYLLAGECS